jgi:hypothetical protein
LRKKKKSAKLRMSRLVPATLFLRDSWVQIPPPALLVSKQQHYFKSVKLVVDWIAGPLTGNAINRPLIGIWNMVRARRLFPISRTLIIHYNRAKGRCYQPVELEGKNPTF